jgi:SHS family sialic acid transporter-like MFS transporter
VTDGIPDLSRGQRHAVLAAAFLAWTFAGLGIALFILDHRPMMLDLLGPGVDERVVTRWFAWFQAAFLFGAAAGGWLFGWLGDRVGRAKALGWSVICQASFTLASYPANTPEGLMVLRFLACLGIGGVWPNAVALVAEAWPDASRPFLAGLLGAAANVGQVGMGVLGYCFDVTPASWRWTMVAAASPVLFGVWVLVAVPESARWLQARSRPVTEVLSGPVREIFRPPLLGRTLLGIGLGAIPVIGTAANGNWLVPWSDQAAQQQVEVAGERGESAEKKVGDPRSKAVTQIVRSGGGIFGSLLGGFIAAVLGRRLSYFLISLLALFTSTYIFTRLDPLDPAFPYWTFILGFISIVYFGWLPLFLPELFPTRVRATGSGVSFNTGRVVSGVVVLSAGFLLDLLGGEYPRVGFATGLIYAVGMFLIWLAPRRAGRLED